MSNIQSLSVIPAPEQKKVLLILNGKLVAEFPMGTARQVAKLLFGAAKVVENECDPVRLVQAQRELIDMGIPIALTSNPLVMKEVNKELRNDGLTPGAMAVGYDGIVSSPTVTSLAPKVKEA